jgi:hypothetical protein
MKALAQRLLFAAILIASLAARAWAVTPVFEETWDPLSTSSSLSGAIGAWYANNFNGTISLNTISAPPWNPSGNGKYLRIVPTQCTPPNECAGMYTSIGNPHKVIAFAVPFQAESAFNSSQTFFLRFNKNTDYPIVSSDYQAWYFDATGHIVAWGNTASTGIADTNWHLIVGCTDHGTGSNGTVNVALDSSLVISATGISNGILATNNLNLDDEFFSGSATTFRFGPFIVWDPGTCTSSTVTAVGAHLYTVNLYPSSNGAVAWTPSIGANYSDVNCVGGCAGYNASNTLGAQDLYNVSGSLGTIFGMGIVTQLVNDGPGDRVTLPVQTISGVTTTGTINTQVQGYNSTATGFSPVGGTVAPTQIGAVNQP